MGKIKLELEKWQLETLRDYFGSNDSAQIAHWAYPVFDKALKKAKNKHARVYNTNGDIVRVEPANGINFSFEELKEIGDGYFEIIQLSDREIMAINEDGKMLNLPINEHATEIYQELIYCNDYIAGIILICDKDQIK